MTRRPHRPLGAAGTALSVVPCAAVLAVWARGQHTCDAWDWSGPRQRTSIGCVRGRLWFDRVTAPSGAPAPVWHAPAASGYRHTPAAEPPTVNVIPADWRGLGFSVTRVSPPGPKVDD